MRHHDNNRKFGRVRKVRKAFMRSLVRGLVMEGKIKTTEARAKELRPMMEKLVTRARKNNIFARRLITSRLGGQPDAVKKLVDEIAPRYKDRDGGYTRITKLPERQGDASPMAIIEFV